jgi:hypothetical protein
MTSAGRLVVRGHYAEGQLRDITVDLQRPSVTRLFIDQLPDAVAKTVPYLFTLCAHAQRAAAQAALAVAQDRTPREADSAELWIEVLHENLWRLLLDWPPALGLPPEKDAFIAWRAARHSEECLAVTQRLLVETLHPLFEKCLKKLAERAPKEVPLGDSISENDSPPAMAPEAWLAYWQGLADAMPPIPKPHSIRSLLMARMAEVEAALAGLATNKPFPLTTAGGEGWGVAQTLTARGVLTHAAHVVDGKVTSYRVQAPTDGYFADASALSSLLGNLEFASLDQAKQGLNQAILALDPCLPYEVELNDA